jgi:hypothetical protein
MVAKMIAVPSLKVRIYSAKIEREGKLGQIANETEYGHVVYNY